MAPLQDFGQKIGGARKDLRGTFRREDIETLTHIERTKLVRKDMVWPTPDYAELVEKDGYSREAVAAIKMLRDAFPACPVVRTDISESDYAKACETYIETLNAMKAAVQGCLTPALLSEKLKTDLAVHLYVARPHGEMRPRQVVVDASEKLKDWNRNGMNMSSNERGEILTAVHYGVTGTLDYTSQKMLRKNPDWPNGTSLAEKAIRKASISMALSGGTWRVAVYGRIIEQASYTSRHREIYTSIHSR